MTFFDLPLNLQLSLLSALLTLVCFCVIAWAGKDGIRDYLNERRMVAIRARAPRGATRIGQEY